jgi:hypothetical protein
VDTARVLQSRRLKSFSCGCRGAAAYLEIEININRFVERRPTLFSSIGLLSLLGLIY